MEERKLLDETHSINVDSVMNYVREIAILALAVLWGGLSIIYYFFAHKFPPEIWSFVGLILITALLELFIWNIFMTMGKVHRSIGYRLFFSLKMSFLLIIYRGLLFIFLYLFIWAIFMIVFVFMTWSFDSLYTFMVENFWMRLITLLIVDLGFVFFVFNPKNIDKKKVEQATYQ